jgi:hypothetical protein
MRQRNCEGIGMLRRPEVEILSLSASRVAVSSIRAAQVSTMCPTQADNNSRKLRLRCGCQFPWFALSLRLNIVATYSVFIRCCGKFPQLLGYRSTMATPV